MTAIVDYGVGNLFSLLCSLDAIGEQAVVTPDPDELRRADRVILPGVGAFADAASRLRSQNLDLTLKDIAESRKPLMEYGEHEGLGLLKGTVRPIEEILRESEMDPERRLKIPQMGWNALRLRKKSSLFRYIKDGDFVYFVHSYAATDCGDSILADTEYGANLTACAGRDNVFGCQFHPEKSGQVGLNILRAFCEME